MDELTLSIRMDSPTKSRSGRSPKQHIGLALHAPSAPNLRKSCQLSRPFQASADDSLASDPLCEILSSFKAGTVIEVVIKAMTMSIVNRVGENTCAL